MRRHSVISIAGTWRSLAQFGFAFSLLLPIALFRFIDADEGSLLYGTQLFLEHRLPYRDFFFQQPPMFIGFFGLLLSPIGIGWYAGRTLCAAVAAATGALVARAVRARGLDQRWEWLAVGLFCSTALIFGWLTVLKTYGLAALGLVAAHGITLRARNASPAMAIGVGACLAVAFWTRIYLVLVVPLVVFEFVRQQAPERRTQMLALVALGVLLPSIPMLILVAAAPEQAFHDVIVYHMTLQLNPGGGSSAVPIGQKWDVVTKLLALQPEDRLLGVQVLALMAAAIVGERGKGYSLSPTARLLVMLVVLTLLPVGIHVQYFCVCGPFLVELAVVGLASIVWRHGASTRFRVAAVLVGAAYLTLGAGEVYRHTVSGNQLEGVGSEAEAPAWRIARVEKVADIVQGYASCGSVMTSWPGYLVGIPIPPWPGAEHHFSTVAARAVPESQRRRLLHMVSVDDLRELARLQAPPVWIVGNCWEFHFGIWPLVDAGYLLVLDDHDVSIWISPSAPCVRGTEPAK